MLCGLLRANGIACLHRRTDLGGGMADGARRGRADAVLVEEEQLEDARKLLPADR